jgi:methionyl-tRNA synthetase
VYTSSTETRQESTESQYRRETRIHNFYITTTLPYANAVPHVGHAIEFFQADAYARYFRSKLGRDAVFFNVGIDEHGLKVLTTAAENGTSPEEYLDQLAPHWLDFCNKFQITHDYFYRTSTNDHHQGAQNNWAKCVEQGDIYKKHYEGLYCVGCEAFILEKDLVDGKCPDHGTAPIPQAEENYFFSLSKYAEEILRFLENAEDFLKPARMLPELLNFIKSMDDISVSRMRSNLPWGIEVPDDPEHTMYVWFDALTNYIRVLGFDNDLERFNSWWPGVQICGPDNLRFQGAIWQGMLASLRLPFTRKLLVHGTIFGPDGQKMSKSRGNVIAPLEQFEKFGSDLCRFYMLAVLHTYSNCSYREEELLHAYTTYLANNYGNLLSRVIHLANKRGINLLESAGVEAEFKNQVDALCLQIEAAYEEFELHTAASLINELATLGNQLIHSREPWQQEIDPATTTLRNAAYLLQAVNKHYEPIIPESAGKAADALRNQEKIILFPRLKV